MIFLVTNGQIPPCIDNTTLHKGYYDPLAPTSSLWDLANSYTPPPPNSNINYNGPPLEKMETIVFTTKERSYTYQEKPLNSMFGIDLSYNKFTGEIPLQIGYLFRIRALNLSHDNLIGSIPPTFSNLKQIESLDLYNNKFNGKIPPQLVELIALAVFTVWYTITYQIRCQSGRHNLQRLTRVATREILFFVDCHCPGVAMKTDHYHQSQKMMIIVSLTWAVSTSLLQYLM